MTPEEKAAEQARWLENEMQEAPTEPEWDPLGPRSDPPYAPADTAEDLANYAVPKVKKYWKGLDGENFPFWCYVFFPNSGDLWMGAPGSNHYEVMEDNFNYDWTWFVQEKPIFGQVWDKGNHANITDNESDYLQESIDGMSEAEDAGDDPEVTGDDLYKLWEAPTDPTARNRMYEAVVAHMRQYGYDKEIWLRDQLGWQGAVEPQLKTAAYATGESQPGSEFPCFGYVDGILYMGQRHHMAIMRELLDEGRDWAWLMEVPQAWGWIESYVSDDYEPIGASVLFATDAARLDLEAKIEARQALEELYGVSFDVNNGQQSNSTYAPDYDANYGENGWNTSYEPIEVYKYVPSWTKAKLRQTSNRKESMQPERQIGDWTIREMNSAEYPMHDALLADRRNKILYINYDGHHSPIFEQYPELYQVPSNEQAQGHWRREPSTTESFGSGWGWHGNEGTEEELALFAQVMAEHYGVQDIYDSIESEGPGYDEDAYHEEDYDEDEEYHNPFESHVAAGGYIWIDNPTMILSRPLPWKAAYNVNTDTLTITHDMNVKLQGHAKLKGFYSKIEKAKGDLPYWTDRAKQLAGLALAERYPTTTKQASSLLRWVLTDDGTVTISDDNSHGDIMDRIWNDKYGNVDPVTWFKNYHKTFVTVGYIDQDGTIESVRSTGERAFDPQDVARLVYDQASAEGYQVTGQVQYRDMSGPGSNSAAQYFEIA